MIIGVAAETAGDEYRVGLSPFAVGRLVDLGHEVVVEKSAGADARFADRDYQAVGARIVYSGEEVFGRADLVAAVGRISPSQAAMLRPKSVVCAFQHLAVAPRRHIDACLEREITLVGYELVRDAAGEFPIMLPFSEMAGQLALHTASHYLQNEHGGRGILLGSVAGVAPPTVLILGAGQVGQFTAVHARCAGSHVIVIDSNTAHLRRVHELTGGQVVTVQAGADRLEKYTAIADVVVGAVRIPGGRAPFLVSEAMVRGMKPGSVIIDLSIDQGGCVETSRPTTLADPVFVAHKVTHYCVPNMTSAVARTASRALSSCALPFLVEIAGEGIEAALRKNEGLASGVYMHAGQLTNDRVADSLGVKVRKVQSLLEGGRA